ncbi:MAG: energy-coupling factor ABC transporter ATP-binding protein [Candidatus Latescibacteria bacterium]|nr:energy-coupling factor ABC transporter ATP-binding protein [Candidatus Latescibacterota bacterium]
MNPSLDIHDLHFAYRDATTRALDGVSFTVHPGEFIGVVGSTGAGKSTLCRCLNGLIPLVIRGTMSGEARVSGKPVSGQRVADLARTVGMVFQDFEAQLFSTSVELEVAFGLENFGAPREEMVERVGWALGAVGLTGFERRMPSSLSGGEKQRLVIAAVLGMGPKILVMDEPTTDLDPVGKGEILRLTQHLRQTMEAFVIVEHETEHLLGASRILVVDGGRVVAEGQPGEVFRKVDLLERTGVRPPTGVLLTRWLGVELPLGWKAAAETLIRMGWWVDRERLASYQREDESRRGRYGEVIIEVQRLSYRYEGAERPAVNEVSFTIRRGEAIAILGKNGCGKTTLVKHVNRLLEPTEGCVKVLGRETRSWPVGEIARHVGYVFQNPDHQLFAETVFDEVAFGLRNAGVAEEKVVQRVKGVLEEMGLASYDSLDPFLLTKGERQMVAVASVLAVEPEILILDEPTTGLDERGRRAIVEFLKRFNVEGNTIMIVTHSMETAAACADRCLVMSDGKIVADRWTREVFADEELLTKAALEPPEVTRIGNRLGGTTLSIGECVDCLRREEA